MLPDRRRMWGDQALNALLIGLPCILIGLACAFLVAWWVGVLVGLLGIGLWWWSGRAWRRRFRIVTQAFPAAWRDFLQAEVKYFARLPAEEQQRFEAMVQVFLAEVPILAVGCELSEGDRLLVAASAVIPVFGFPMWEYGDLHRVLVRPHAFNVDFDEGQGVERDAAGMVTVGGLLDGVVVLALDALRRGYQDDDADNVGIHEFAHLVDGAMGGINGIPAGLTQSSYQPWLAMMQAEFKRRSHSTRALRAYGYTNEQEFFAVACEHFFERPDQLRRDSPELYRLLCRVFRQDLLARMTRRLRR